MNLMERKNQEEEQDWREDLRLGLQEEKQAEKDRISAENPDQEAQDEENTGTAEKLQGLLQRPYMTIVLLGVIVVLLICIIVLLLLLPGNSKGTPTTAEVDLHQSITQYAQEQKQNDHVSGLSGETVSIEPEKEKTDESAMTEPKPETESRLTAADGDKTAVVVDVEDESDVSYSKEYILNEALPYFADNNQDAIWDITHLKRYVKLSSELENTGQYYYTGDVNSDGKPHGKGLAIYENNSYYYGDWSDGVRSGTGTWYRFYIGKKNKYNAMGKYMSHIYAGAWANDLPNGQGAEHYDVDISKLAGQERIIRNVVGNFTDGLYNGEMYADTVDHIGNVEEWDGITTMGVFTLWRDMSAIGECSVWRNKDDYTLCMDIDKADNKNQGIRELLKTDTK